MNAFARTLAPALIAATFSLGATAAQTTLLSPDQIAWHDAAAAARPQLQRVRAAPQTAAPAPKVMGNEVNPGTPMANAFRAYPPSCAADPLPNKSRGTTWSGDVQLLAGNSIGQQFLETIKVTVWRLACSSSGAALAYNPTGAYNAITLVRFDRASDKEGSRSSWPYMPLVQAAQGSISDFAQDPKTLIRLATEPNTVISEFPYGQAMFDSTTFVLENYPYVDSGYFTFSDGFRLRVNPYLQGIAPLDLDIPAYEATASTYPRAFQNVPLDGYAAAQWQNYEFDEGLLVQIAEAYDGNKPTRRLLVFDLLTRDPAGQAFWLVGSAAFDPVAEGVGSLTADASYLGAHQAGGGFQQFAWGKAKFEMLSCNELRVTYTPRPNLPADVPSFSGATSYSRLFSANGMLCE